MTWLIVLIVLIVLVALVGLFLYNGLITKRRTPGRRSTSSSSGGTI
jgi:hypothetical protein